MFDETVDNNKIKENKNVAFISILDPDNLERKYLDNENFLQVFMWDIEQDVDKYKKPSETELQKIVDFVNLNKNKLSFVIHCSAGISRSGAVARYLFYKFYDEVDIDYFNINNKYIQPNLYILNKLKELDNINIY